MHSKSRSTETSAGLNIKLDLWVSKLHGCVNMMIFYLGEAMEQGLRDCCRSIRIGKILVHTDEETHDAKVVYAKLPPDIANRKVLLMYPIMSKKFVF